MRRMARDLTALFFGDPLGGRSLLQTSGSETISMANHRASAAKLVRDSGLAFYSDFLQTFCQTQRADSGKAKTEFR